MKIILGIIICLCSIGVIAKGVYQQPTAFLNGVFNHKIPKARMIWLTRARRLQISKILGHKPNRLRNKGRIELMKVLIFRETRGWEVRYPFFTNKFDGISGATLSVRALKKLAKLSLYLHKQQQGKRF